MIDKIDKAILAELNHWDLSCSEEPALKIELAKALGRAVENCFTSTVTEQSKQLPNKYCPQCGEPIAQKHKFWCKERS